MIQVTPQMRILVAVEPVDFRKGIDGLARVCKAELQSDPFSGWSKEALRRNIRFLAYNTRFLVLPWVEVRHLASHILGRMTRVVPRDWERVYGHPIWYLESFVEPGRFRGTCYRAANWKFLGLTTGRGKNDQTKKANRPLKEVLGYPLTRGFRDLLSRLQ